MAIGCSFFNFDLFILIVTTFIICIIIVIIFGTLEDQFLTARNFTNLLLQMAPVAALAMGIVFILLIFFIVTTTFVDETGVEVDKPQAASAAQLEKTSIMLALTAKGEVVYDKRDIGIGSVRATVRRLLQKENDIPVIIQADTTVPTGLLVRVIDEAKLGARLQHPNIVWAIDTGEIPGR